MKSEMHSVKPKEGRGYSSELNKCADREGTICSKVMCQAPYVYGQKLNSITQNPKTTND